MRLPLEVHVGIEGVLATEVVRPDGTVVSRVEQPNLLTDEGLEALGNVALGLQSFTHALDGWALLGSRADAPAVGDIGQDLGAAWDDPLGAKYAGTTSLADCDLGGVHAPVRSVRAASQDDGGFGFQSRTLVDDTYWEGSVIREFRDTDAYFLLRGAASPNVPELEPWNLEDEHDMLTEFSLCSSVQVPSFQQTCSEELTITWETWELGPILNRVLLEDEAGNPTSYGWDPDADPDVLLESDSILRFTWTWRIYPPVTPVEQMLDIEGVSTTVRTRAYDLNGGGWANGLSRHLGLWQTSQGTSGAGVNEAQTFPPLLGTIAGWENFAGVTDLGNGLGFADRRYHVAPSGALFSGGIGSILHGAVTEDFDPCFMTTFDPAVQKTDLDKVTFDVRYTWGRR